MMMMMMIVMMVMMMVITIMILMKMMMMIMLAMFVDNLLMDIAGNKLRVWVKCPTASKPLALKKPQRWFNIFAIFYLLH